jgi:hypothetical protein
MCYKARVCLEGVPADAHQVETIRGLFGASDIIERIDDVVNSKEESACCRVWVWMENVATLARRGRLDLEEPLEVDSPLLHFPELGMEVDLPVRTGPLRTLSYDVLLHLDRVLDYSASPPSSPDSHVSYHSDISGLPSEVSLTPACPTTWGYRWNLGFEAGTFPPTRRAPVHSRLRFPGGRDGEDGTGGGPGGSSGWQQQGGDGGASQGRTQPAVGVSSPRFGTPAGNSYHCQLAGLEVGPAFPLAIQSVQDQATLLEPVVQEVEQADQRVECMPHLLDSDHQLSQTEPVREEPKGKEAEGLEDVAIGVHGLAGQVCLQWGSPAEDGDSAGDGNQIVTQQPELEREPEREGIHEREEDSFFGPHSPRTMPGPNEDEPIVEDASDTCPVDGPVDPLQDFLLSVSKPVPQALLPVPPPDSEQEATVKIQKGKGMEIQKRSDRLAAKPTAGWSAMDKVQLVLLKKSGMLPEEASPQAADLQRYRKLYSKPLPPLFIDAVTALVESGSGGKIKPAERSLLAA